MRSNLSLILLRHFGFRLCFLSVFPSFSMVVFWFGYCDGIHDCATSQNITVNTCLCRMSPCRATSIHKLQIQIKSQLAVRWLLTSQTPRTSRRKPHQFKTETTKKKEKKRQNRQLARFCCPHTACSYPESERALLDYAAITSAISHYPQPPSFAPPFSSASKRELFADAVVGFGVATNTQPPQKNT